MSVVTQQARDWAASGAMALTGRPDGPPLVAPDGIVDRIRELGAPLGVDPLPLMSERAAIVGLRRRGAVSCGGSSRLLRAVDGWVAVSLARTSDVELVPAWLETDRHDPDDPWPTVTDAVARLPTATVVERGVLVGLPLAAVPHEAAPATKPDAVRATQVGDASAATEVSWRTDTSFEDAGGRGGHIAHGNDAATSFGNRDRTNDVDSTPRPGAGGRPLVVDLSSLWAGPLCARLLGDRGARVVKVESVRRPDGARSGPAAFFDLLHHGHEMVALDLADAVGVERLRRLLDAADVVIESSRPRALEQLGLDATKLLETGPTVWVSITGHGRQGPGRNRVAFGDDAAAGGGLIANDPGGPVFVADAVADPLTGVAAAAAVVEALDTGGRWLLDVALTRVAAHVAGAASGSTWTAGADEHAQPPRTPVPRGEAAALGEHTKTVFAGL